MLSSLKRLLFIVMFIFVSFISYNILVNNYSLVDKFAENKRQISASEIANRLSSIQELATAQYDYETIGSLKDSWYFSEKNLIIRFKGTIKYGYDLSSITVDKIQVDGQNVSIHLPPPSILSNELDTCYTKTLIEDNGWWNKLHADDIVKVEEQAKADAEYRVKYHDSLKQTAENNATKALVMLAKSIDKECNIKVVCQ